MTDTQSARKQSGFSRATGISWQSKVVIQRQASPPQTQRNKKKQNKLLNLLAQRHRNILQEQLRADKLEQRSRGCRISSHRSESVFFFFYIYTLRLSHWCLSLRIPVTYLHHKTTQTRKKKKKQPQQQQKRGASPPNVSSSKKM